MPWLRVKFSKHSTDGDGQHCRISWFVFDCLYLQDKTIPEKNHQPSQKQNPNFKKC